VAVGDTDCIASVTFRVTLPDTSVASELVSGRGGGLPPIVFIVAAIAGFVGGNKVARHLRLRGFGLVKQIGREASR
jgi:hypothetical protein